MLCDSRLHSLSLTINELYPIYCNSFCPLDVILMMFKSLRGLSCNRFSNIYYSRADLAPECDKIISGDLLFFYNKGALSMVVN